MLLSEAEREAKFEAKKQEVIERLLGKEQKYPIPDPVQTRFIDTNWRTGKSWYDESRVHKNMNHDTSYLVEYYKEIHRTGGRIVRRIEASELPKEEPPVVK